MGCQFVLGLVCFPWHGMGFLRYMPWVCVLVSFAAVALLGELVAKKHVIWVALVLSAFVAFKHVPGLVLGEVYGFGETERGQNKAADPVYAYSFDMMPRTDAETDALVKKFSFIPQQCKLGHSAVNNIKLLFKERYGFYPNVVPLPISYLKCDKTFYRGGYCRLPSKELRERSPYEKGMIALRKLLPCVRICVGDVAYRAGVLFR